jgi:hypothetical protein
MRGLRKFTSKQIIKTIAEHPGESRKEWMLRMFREAGEANSNNKDLQFRAPAPKPATAPGHNSTTSRSSYRRTR